jgi:branched-chain amino acid transport system substrate-binding protein
VKSVRALQLASAMVLSLGAASALAQGAIKLGIVGEFSGPFAQYGQQILGGMKAYMKANGDTIAGKKIEIVQKDTTGPAPDVAKRVRGEFVLTPESVCETDRGNAASKYIGEWQRARSVRKMCVVPE